MNEKSFSFLAWLTGAARKRKSTVDSGEPCTSCRLPIEQLQSVYAMGGGQARCRVCRGMIESANTPYLQAVQEEYLEEQKRKKALLLGGNYLS